MQPFIFNQEVRDDYRSYIKTTFPIKNAVLAKKFDEQIAQKHLVWKGPYISLSQEFKKGASIDELVKDGLLHPEMNNVFPGWVLRFHQELALRSIAQLQNTIVATGTGSGKTEAFLMPIIDYCLKHRGVQGTKALLLYPMNALANDQLDRIKKLLKGHGVTFGIFTGTTPQDKGNNEGIDEFVPSRTEIRQRKPDILLTNYSMLELLLTRREDKVLFLEKQLQFLVLDEVHTYSGILGTELAALIRRLKSHTGTIDRLTCIGTSATIEKGEGEEPKKKICNFASELFGETFLPEHVVEEHYEPRERDSRLYEPEFPERFDHAKLSDMLLHGADDTTLAEVTKNLCGALLKNEYGIASALITLKKNKLFILLEDLLSMPRSIEELCKEVKREIASRAHLPDEKVKEEIEAYLLVASLLEKKSGEKLILPRLHNFYRGLHNIQLCSNPNCHTFVEQGTETCPSCGKKTLTFETCRTCGESYLRAEYEGESDFRHMMYVSLKATESFDSHDKTLHLSYNFELLENDLGRNDIIQGCFCSSCSTLTTNLDYCDDVCINPDCTGIMKPVVVVIGNTRKNGTITNCPSCGDYIGAGRDIVTPLTTFQAPTVSMLTKAMFDHLDENEKRMMIFADNRQDTAYQAGYINDKINEFIIRQLIYKVIKENENLPLTELGTLVYEKALIYKIEQPYQNEYQRKKKIAQYDYLCFETFCTNKGARTSLEGLGIIQTKYEQLGRLIKNRAWDALKALSDLDDDALLNLLGSIINIIRYQKSVKYPLYQWKRIKSNQKFSELKNKIEDEEFKLPRDNYFTPKGVCKQQRSTPEENNFKTINFYNEGSAHSAIQSYMHKIFSDSSQVHEILDLIQNMLVEERILVDAIIGGNENHRADVYMLDPAFITLTTKEEVFQCERCLLKTSYNVKEACTKYRCQGKLALYTTDLGNFFAQIYTQKEPIKIKSAEHSGQISAKLREQYETQFKEGKINLLVCTPTMELGVDIGDLPTIFMMNTPPKPANYAQRAGRAGRSDRLFSVAAYSSLSPHDSYYYNHPDEMIRGEISTPLFRLNNPAVITRHIRSILLEKIETSFPKTMKDMLHGASLKKDLDIFSEIDQRKEELAHIVCEVFIEKELPWITKENILKIIENFISDLENALEPYLATLNRLAKRYRELHDKLDDPFIKVTKEEQNIYENERKRIREKIYKMREDPNESYTMKVLAKYGFLPSYAFPTNMLQLDAYDFDEPIQRDKDIGINEFAPGNIVYVGGGKYEVKYVGLDNTSEEKFKKYKICKRCSHKMFEDVEFIELCEQCGSDRLDEKYYLEPQVLYARRFSPIKASEEIRKRRRFSIEKQCIDSHDKKLLANAYGALLVYQKNSEIVSRNLGPFSEEGAPMGFAFCNKCGFSFDLQDQHHLDKSINEHARSSCDGEIEYNVDLISRISVDSVTIQMTLPDEKGLEFLTTLLHSYLNASSIFFEMDANELRGFIQHVPAPVDEDVYKIVIYDSTLGGSGVLKEFVEHFAEISKKAYQLLTECPCDTACYKCLKTYYNQRDHSRLDKKLVIDTLATYAELDSLKVQQIDVEEYKKVTEPFSKEEIEEILHFEEGEETPIERILREAIERSDLPKSQLQYEIFENGKLITKPDFAYVEKKIAIYADGYLYHKSKEAFERDRNIDRWLQKHGWKTLRFPGGLIYRNVDMCLKDIKIFFKSHGMEQQS